MKIQLLNKELYGELKPQTIGSAGIDLRSNETHQITVLKEDTYKFKTGIKIAIDRPYAGMVLSRSGIGSKGTIVSQGVGLIDPDYRGELIVPIYNRTNELLFIKPGDRIAQLVLVNMFDMHQLKIVDELDETERGSGGFGHTGVR